MMMISQTSRVSIVLAAALAAACVAVAPAYAASGVKVGMLDCDVSAGAGFIIGSSKEVTCTYKAASGHAEHYRGSIGKLGIDVGVTGKTSMAWAVFAPGKLNRGALAGNYGGASAEATVAVGLGANVLVGGSKNSIALQPFSVQGQTGLNLAAGLANLNLKYVK
jgi:hypothetical protein